MPEIPSARTCATRSAQVREKMMIVEATITFISRPNRLANRQRRFRQGENPWFDGPIPIDKLNEIDEYIKITHPLVERTRVNGRGFVELTLTHQAFPSACFLTEGHYRDFVLCIEQMFKVRAVELQPHEG